MRCIVWICRNLARFRPSVAAAFCVSLLWSVAPSAGQTPPSAAAPAAQPPAPVASSESVPLDDRADQPDQPQQPDQSQQPQSRDTNGLANPAAKSSAPPDPLAPAPTPPLTTPPESVQSQPEAAPLPNDSAQPTPARDSFRYKNGYSWLTRDERYALRLVGQLQVRYLLRATDTDIDTSTLAFRRARLGAIGRIGDPDLSFMLVISVVRAPSALFYYSEYQISDDFKLRVGQYKVQHTRNFMASSLEMAFLERPVAIELFRYSADLQVGMFGKFADGRIAFYAGVGNGGGVNAVNDNLDILTNVRADITLLGKPLRYSYTDLRNTQEPTLVVGAGMVHDVTATPSDIGGIALTNVEGTGVRALSASFDAQFRYRGFEVATEVLYRREWYGGLLEDPANADLVAAVGAGDTRSYLGLFGQLTYTFRERLVTGVRAGRADVPFLGLGGRSSRLPRGDSVVEYDALVHLFSPRRHRLLGVLYSHHTYRDADDSQLSEHRLICEGQLFF